MEILYQDESLLLVNKPAGLLTIRDGYDPSLPNLIGEVRKEFEDCWVVHRLDKETSGLVLFARTASAHRILNQQFQERKVRKEYLALSYGIFNKKDFTINAPLKVNGDRKHRTLVDHVQGKSAESQVAVLDEFEAVSLVKVHPISGYTHQIRAHLAFIGHPILGDSLYFRRDLGFSPIDPSIISRVALHACQIEFSHPVTGSPVCIKAEAPPDFSFALACLKKSSGVSSG